MRVLIRVTEHASHTVSWSIALNSLLVDCSENDSLLLTFSCSESMDISRSVAARAAMDAGLVTEHLSLWQLLFRIRCSYWTSWYQQMVSLQDASVQGNLAHKKLPPLGPYSIPMLRDQR